MLCRYFIFESLIILLWHFWVWCGSVGGGSNGNGGNFTRRSICFCIIVRPFSIRFFSSLLFLRGGNNLIYMHFGWWCSFARVIWYWDWKRFFVRKGDTIVGDCVLVINRKRDRLSRTLAHTHPSQSPSFWGDVFKEMVGILMAFNHT